MLNDFYNFNESEVQDKKEHCNKFYTSEQVRVMDIEEVIKGMPDFSERLVVKARIKNLFAIEEKYIKEMKQINKATKRKYSIWKLYIHKLTDVTVKDTIPETYQINIVKDSSIDTLTKDRDYVSDKIKKLRVYYYNSYKEQMEQIDRHIIKPLWKEWSLRFVEPFADVNYGYSITVHKSQGSTYYNVFIDVHDILKNNEENELKRCVYTAFTRTSNELHLLIRSNK